MAEESRPAQGRRSFLVLSLVLIVLIAAIGVWGFLVFTGPGPSRPGPSRSSPQSVSGAGGQTIVDIAPGTGLRAIARKLETAGVIRHADVFYVGVRLFGLAHVLKAGEYAIASGASMRAIAEQLAAGRSIVHKLTAAEGLTSKMVYDLVVADTTLTGAAGDVPEEGSLLPETYLFDRGTTRRQLLAKMHAAQTRLIDSLWPGRAAGLPFKTKREAVILASIVEKETALPAERRHIASVFINRLKIGMRLQSDPTIIYGVTRGYPLGRSILKVEVEARTPYNTYVISGLPAGPICNPGRDAIAAVLHPVESKDLYFVADGTGGHQFAATIEAQTRNVRRWRHIKQARDAKL